MLLMNGDYGIKRALSATSKVNFRHLSMVKAALILHTHIITRLWVPVFYQSTGRSRRICGGLTPGGFNTIPSKY